MFYEIIVGEVVVKFPSNISHEQLVLGRRDAEAAGAA